MLISGPSKAGKSFALIELCISIAEGVPWMGLEVETGGVLYVNLELDRASCLHRFQDVYQAMGLRPRNMDAIDIWNLRGRSTPMDKLAPKLIRRAQKKGYTAVIIDPIYKVITGDENSADQMAKFCNQFDLICARLGCAVIYCHHHSKGSQGQKASMDRASGSGVFARDPDALLDMIELPVSEALQKAEGDRAVIGLCKAALDSSICMGMVKWEDALSQDDLCSAVRCMAMCEKLLAPFEYQRLTAEVAAARARIKKRTAWRIEGTLREFERFEPVNLWFEYPVHQPDMAGVLQDVMPEDPRGDWRERGKKKLMENNQQLQSSIVTNIGNQIDFSPTGSVAIRELILSNKKGEPYTADKIGEWFGNGRNARSDLKAQFEKYIGEDGRSYLRRKREATNADD
jgi:RecA-family ATPase